MGIFDWFKPKPDLEKIPRPAQSAVGQKKLWYPAAEQVKGITMKTNGTYEDGYPRGAIVHFTSGRSKKGDSDAINTMQGAIRDGYGYLCISADGTVFQQFPLNKWTSHAGVSSWPGLGTSVSSKLVGIEICNAGDVTRLDKTRFKSWFGEIYPQDEVRQIEDRDANRSPGFYHKYTEAQEQSLIALLLWLHRNNPEVFKIQNVLGHDEVSPKRKVDPGGSLSWNMVDFRALLLKRLKEQS